MTNEGRSPLDHSRTAEVASRAARFAEIERRSDARPGRKEMALTRRPRAENAKGRAPNYAAIERGREI